MKKTLLALLTTALLSGAALAQTNGAAGTTPAAGARKEDAVKKEGALYGCPQCHMQAKKAGKCSMDGAEMKAMHVMKDKDGKKYVCGCPSNCDCTLKEGDKTQCTHNMPVNEVKMMKEGGEKPATPAAKTE